MAEREEKKKEEQPTLGVETAPVEQPQESPLSVYYREKYPDMTFEAEGDMYSDAAQKLRDADARNAKFDEANAALNEVMEDYPEFAEIITDLQNGVELRVALGKHFDPEDFVVEPGEAIEQDYTKVKEERKARRKEAEERMNSFKEEWKKSIELINSISEWDKEKEEEFGQWLGTSINDIAAGKISPELLKKLRHAFVFEEAIEEARKDGEIDGRNAEIEAKRIKKAESGDGMPSTGAAGSRKPQEAAPEEYDPFGDVERKIDARNRKRLGM